VKRIKFLWTLIFSLSVFVGHAQKKFVADKGEMSFTSNASLEVIKATSHQMQGIVDPANGQVAFIVKVKSFEGFNSNLQKEHFNEKYMESDKFYNATFTGRIVEQIDFSKDGEYTVIAKGGLTIHGKKQPRMITGKIKIEKGKLIIDSSFDVTLADHDIKIPEIVGAKIATKIFVKLNVALIQK
jgi:polyisoprenoid-binding protein YceI